MFWEGWLIIVHVNHLDTESRGSSQLRISLIRCDDGQSILFTNFSIENDVGSHYSFVRWAYRKSIVRITVDYVIQNPSVQSLIRVTR